MIDEYCAILTFKVPTTTNAVCFVICNNVLDGAMTKIVDPYQTVTVGSGSILFASIRVKLELTGREKF